MHETGLDDYFRGGSGHVFRTAAVHLCSRQGAVNGGGPSGSALPTVVHWPVRLPDSLPERPGFANFLFNPMPQKLP